MSGFLPKCCLSLPEILGTLKIMNPRLKNLFFSFYYDTGCNFMSLVNIYNYNKLRKQ
jgi:hypothetical protein